MSVAEILQKKKLSFTVIPHAATYDAQRMAAALHVPGRNVGKTVLLKADGGYAFIVAVVPAHKSVDLGLASKLLGGSQLELACEQDILRHCPDCELGVLPPFGSEYGMKTIVDRSLSQIEEIIFEADSHEEAIRLKFDDYCRSEQPLMGVIST